MTTDERKKQVQESINTLGSRTNFDNLRKIKNILNSVFGEEHNQIISPSSVEQFEEVVRRGDITVERVYVARDDLFAQIVEGCVIYEVLLHFPTVTITNSRGESIDIEDLYVSFYIRPDGKLKQNRIYGARTTYSNQQYLSGYRHSHLRSRTISSNTFGKFCLGVGPIKQVMTLLIAEFNEINFNLFCLQLRNYVSWESLEGNPHFPMERISTSSSMLNPIPYDLLNNILDMLAIQILGEQGWIKDNLRFEFGRREVKVTMPEEGERNLAQLIIDDSVLLSSIINKTHGFERYASNYIISVGICTKDYQGSYFSLSEDQIDELSLSPTPLLKFKGEDKFLKITGTDKNLKIIKYAHPKIISGICRLFSEKFTKEVIAAEGTTF